MIVDLKKNSFSEVFSHFDGLLTVRYEEKSVFDRSTTIETAKKAKGCISPHSRLYAVKPPVEAELETKNLKIII